MKQMEGENSLGCLLGRSASLQDQNNENWFNGPKCHYYMQLCLIDAMPVAAEDISRAVVKEMARHLRGGKERQQHLPLRRALRWLVGSLEVGKTMKGCRTWSSAARALTSSYRVILSWRRYMC